MKKKLLSAVLAMVIAVTTIPGITAGAATKKISSLSISKISDQSYTGKALKPSVTVKDGSKTLKSGTDYTLSYGNNKNIGKASVKITGKGNYTGTASKTFNIVPAKTTVSEITRSGQKFTISWKKSAGSVGGYKIYHSTEKDGEYKLLKNVKDGSQTSYTSKKLDENKTHYFRVTAYKKVDGKTYTGARSDVLSGPRAFRDITAEKLVSEIKIGWNLGNSLDATDFGEGWMSSDLSVAKLETAWSNPAVTKANIDAVKAAGFSAVRIPVSWFKAAGGAPNYTIRADWMARVTEVVDYAVANDMYVILNIHHEEYHGYGKTDRLRFDGTEAQITESLNAYRKIWEQIADNFKTYDEKLIFEGLNEPRVIGSKEEWSGGTAKQREILNRYYPVFVDAVRKSGGNNDKRFLMITTYGASTTATAVNGLVLPKDTAANKLIVSIHAYVPYTFCYDPDSGSTTKWSASNSADTKAIQDALQPAYDKFIAKGVPVIIGEFGVVHKNNASARAAWAEYYVSYANSKGFRCFLWDNGVTSVDYEGAELFGFLNRKTNKFAFTGVIDALMRGAK
ncbi:MAG: cellulase family glycosylhydrolase [Oscillospiraceae bacterium]|nr:cellulase family glycosylhydrolase [Oscillospiraceae bacterium]